MTNKHDSISIEMIPHSINLFLNLAALIDLISLLEMIMSFCISYRFFRVEFSSLSDWLYRLNLMSLAILSHSIPTAFAFSSSLLFCSRILSCLPRLP